MLAVNLRLFGIFLIYSTVLTIGSFSKELSNVNSGYGPKLLYLIMSFQHSNFNHRIGLVRPLLFQLHKYLRHLHTAYTEEMLLKAFLPPPIKTHENFHPTEHKHIQTQMHVTLTAQGFNL